MNSSKASPAQLQHVKQPRNVKVLILSESKTSIKEFYYIKTYINLIKIDLSYNKLSSFPPNFTFTSFHSLRTLFLHYNKFNVIKNLAPLTSSRTLIYLTLFGNPLEEAKARHFIVNQVPSIMLMDNKIVKLEERDQEFNTAYSQAEAVAFPLIKHQNQEDTQLYLQNMVKELRIVRQKYLQANPIVRLQRWWKHILRLKHRKWKITELPFQKEKSSTVYGLKHHKQNLDRLNTEQMKDHSSNQQKIRALFDGNLQFWNFLREYIKNDEIYFTRHFCSLNAIKYSQVADLRVFRYLTKPNQVMLRKRRLMFFIQHHNHIIASKVKNKKPLVGSSLEAQTKFLSSKRNEYNSTKLQRTKANLERLQKRYRCLVKPQLSADEIFSIIQKEYFRALRTSLKGIVTQEFPVVCKKLLLRTLSAVKIQNWWKGLRVRRIHNITKSVRAVNAATKIQRWIRNLRFIHRFKFLLEVGIYLKKERNSAEIMLQMSQIAAIQSYCQYKQKGINFNISFQQCSFSFDQNLGMSNQISAINANRSKIIFNSDRKPYPSYLKLTFKNQKTQSNTTYNVLEILFKEAKSIRSLVDSKGVKYIHFVYHSPQDALNRKFILALKTYRMQNHQFITSVSISSGPAQVATDWLEVVNDNKLVNIQTDSLVIHRKDTQIKNLASQRSCESLGSSEMGLTDGSIYLKVKFFVATTNYSCFLIINSPKFQAFSSQSTKNLAKKKEYYLGRHKSFSKRYDDQTQNYSKISRNIISLDQALPVNHQKRQNIAYSKILNTDQSHSIIQSITPQSSLQKFELQHKFQTYDRFNREVYPSTSQIAKESSRYKRQLDEIEDLRMKKSIIDQIKESHREKIKEILSKKNENLSTLRGKISREQEENAYKIEKARIELQQKKIKKHNLIKEMKANSGNFELEFMKKGIKSIKKDIKQVQKKCRSFRQQQKEISYLITEMQKKHDLQKTEIKQFSIKITDGDCSFKVTQNGKLKSQNQGQAQYYSNIGAQSNQPSLNLRSQSLQDLSNLKEDQNQEKMQALQLEKQLKKARKKRLVHSVFPEEFYPLRQSNQIGFELPKITRK